MWEITLEIGYINSSFSVSAIANACVCACRCAACRIAAWNHISVRCTDCFRCTLMEIVDFFLLLDKSFIILLSRLVGIVPHILFLFSTLTAKTMRRRSFFLRKTKFNYAFASCDNHLHIYLTLWIVYTHIPLSFSFFSSLFASWLFFPFW